MLPNAQIKTASPAVKIAPVAVRGPAVSYAVTFSVAAAVAASRIILQRAALSCVTKTLAPKRSTSGARPSAFN